MEQDKAVSSVRCRFITSTPSIRVSSDPLSIPVKLGRKGLSDVVNHLLGSSEKRVYDFLVYDEADSSSNKRMLRKSLRAHFEELDISTEHLITVEYFLALPRPADSGQHDSDEWIGSVVGLNDTTGAGTFLFGNYGGVLSIVHGDQTSLCSVSAHEGAIKAIANSSDIVATGGHDKTLRTWKLSSDELIPVGVGESSNRSHESSVECCAVRSDGLVLSGDWDGRLCMWKSESATSLKKQKTTSGGGSVANLLPTETWKAHTHCLSQVRWLEGSTATTASWDHSIKIWDVERQDCIHTTNTSKVNTCIDVHESMIVSGHTTGCLKLWDTRLNSTSALSFGEMNHGWISGVSWSPMSNVIGATSHNGTLLLLDVRTTKPLYTLRAHGNKGNPDKALCVGWSGSTVASGGTDKVLKMFSFSE